MNLQEAIPLPHAAKLVVDHLGFRIVVSSQEPADLDWLREVLTPAFQICAGETGDLEINVVVDPERHARFHSAGPRDGWQAEPFFSFDEHSAECQPWSGVEPRVYDQELKIFYALTDPVGRIEILAGRWRPSIRIALLRILRELATQRLPGNQCIQLHAAAIENDGCGFLICGPRRAGKTSLLLHLLSTESTCYLANDRAVLHLNVADDVYISGMPTVVSIREHTLKMFAELRLEGMRHWLARMTLAEALASNAPRERSGLPTSLSLSPAHLCHWLQVDTAATVSLSGLLFPIVDEGQTGIQLEPLSTEEIQRNLASSMMPPRATLLNEWVGLRLIEVTDSDADETRWPTVPGYRCILGSDAFSGATSAEHILADLKAGCI